MNKHFWRLFFSQAITNIGDVLYIVALITVFYDVFQSVFLLSLLPFIITICKFSCGMLSPIILDKVELKTLLFLSQLIKTLFFLLLIVTLQGFNINLSAILVLVVCISLADGIQQPVSFALIPSLVEKQYLLKANSATSVSFQTSDLLTWSIGAILVTTIGYVYSMSISLLLYVISLILLLLIKVDSENKAEENPEEDLRTLKTSLTEGWKLILNNKLLTRFLWMDIVKGIAYTVWVAAVLYVFVEEVLKVGQEWWGYINTARILGSLLGGYIVYKYAEKMEGKLKTYMFLASFAISSLSLGFGMNTIPLLSLFLVFLIGFPEQTDEIIQTTMVQERVKEKQLAKVYTAQSMVYYLIFSFSVLGAGALVDLLNVKIIFIAASFILFVNTFITWHIKRNASKYDTQKVYNKSILE